ncbi:MAG: ComF family protein [Verrucomicrobia bacterium]|nr:ComF family protein [Verrucomicrobiota bacterium]
MRVWIEAARGLIFPAGRPPRPWARLERPFCERCAEPYSRTAPGEFLCANCLDRRWSLERVRAAYRAVGTVREAILRFKYGREYHLRPWLGRWMRDGFRQYYAEEKWDALVPVPLHSERKKIRGFNQSAEIARWLSARIGIPVEEGLARVRATLSQARLKRVERLSNLRGALALAPGFDPRGRRLLICDDVFTTGATADACARVLRKAGAAEVAALTVARG